MIEETLTVEEIKSALLIQLFHARKACQPVEERVFQHCFDLLEALQSWEDSRND